jgi:arginine deiminase
MPGAWSTFRSSSSAVPSVTDEGSARLVYLVAKSLGLRSLNVIETGGDVYDSERQQCSELGSLEGVLS